MRYCRIFHVVYRIVACLNQKEEGKLLEDFLFMSLSNKYSPKCLFFSLRHVSSVARTILFPYTFYLHSARG